MKHASTAPCRAGLIKIVNAVVRKDTKEIAIYSYICRFNEVDYGAEKEEIISDEVPSSVV